MSSKNILLGVAAAAVVNVASASNVSFLIEKQYQAAVMNELLDGMAVVISHPECTTKPEKKFSR